MAQEPKQPTLDTRAYALAFWPEPSLPRDSTRLRKAARQEVETMAAAGWLDGPPGAYVLNEVGRQAVAALMPEKLPKLTEAQEERLLLILGEKYGLGLDVDHGPTRQLLAYGALDVKRERFGGRVWCTANARAHAWNGSGPPEAEPEPEATAGPRP